MGEVRAVLHSQLVNFDSSFLYVDLTLPPTEHSLVLEVLIYMALDAGIKGSWLSGLLRVPLKICRRHSANVLEILRIHVDCRVSIRGWWTESSQGRRRTVSFR